MKKTVSVLTTLSMLLILIPCAYAAEYKIAVVDKQKLLLESQAGKDALAELEQVQKEKEAEINQKREAIRKLEEEISIKGLTMSDAAKEELELRHQQMTREMNRFFQDAQEDWKRSQITLLKPISDALDELITNYGQEHGLDLIIDRRTPGVLFSADGIDITPGILALYDKLYQEKKAKKE